VTLTNNCGQGREDLNENISYRMWDFRSQVANITGDIPSFVPQNIIAAPEGASHFKIVSAGAEVDFENDTYKLWTDSAVLALERQEYLAEGQVKELVLKGDIVIAEANCGLKLSWVPPVNSIEFFKKQVKGHVVDDPDRIILSDYQDQWCYLASLWTDPVGQKVVLLETYHWAVDNMDF